MNDKVMVRKMFPGGNTTRGFYSFFDHIIEPDANRLFILKGGPGVGKSTFMKKIGKEMLGRGYRIEEHYCSSSNNSIDGIVIPDIKIAMIDGTAPHIIDPKVPGAVDEIVNLGEYWEPESFEGIKSEIIESQREVSRCFSTAYRYLKAMGIFLNNISLVYEGSRDNKEFYLLQESLLDEIFKDASYKTGIAKTRHLFGSGITPRGVVDYLETIVGVMGKIYYIKGEWGTGWSELLNGIAYRASNLGYYVEAYHTPFNPELIESIIIPELDIALTNNKKFMKKHTKLVDLDRLIDEKMIKKHHEELEFDTRMYHDLLIQSVHHINKAKEAHDVLEGFYISKMNFNSVQKKREEIIKRILMYAGS